MNRSRSSTKAQSRIVSIEEANRMLPLLARVGGDIVRVWDQIILKRTELECIEKNSEAGLLPCWRS